MPEPTPTDDGPEPDPDTDPDTGPDTDPDVDPDLDPDLDPDPADGRRYPSTIGGTLYLGILIAAAAGLGIVAGGDWRVGVRVVAVGLAAAGAFRLVLPEKEAGMLAVRRRATDVVMLAVVAGLLWWLAGDIPDQPMM
ncbi:DUF3017 domain-containing protein [Nocardioides litoris]|uniref:DUF3017 domain-containing protein n=1 Tax=Nocardioides litoris TaxID=1926648 RepID=UPI00111DADEE|nr:DUF3017 domain-containing protein [Nocardioides litoris]